MFVIRLGRKRIEREDIIFMQNEEPIYENLYDKLTEYAVGDYIPFHMPGHKRNYGKFAMGQEAGIDITEIDGFDDYHCPTGIIRDIEKRAADIYGAKESFYLVNGSSCGILAAISASCTRGSDIVVARNCHKSVYNAITINGLNPHYIYPEMDEETGIMGAVTADMVSKAITTHTKAVMITSPTYEGCVSDIESIAGVCHENNIVLIVDGAHGAHFNFNEAFPKAAVRCGADIVIESLHKTLPCYTQTAIMHVSGELADYTNIKRFLSIYQTSSPSYIFMAGINKCIDYMVSDKGRKANDEYVGNLKKLRASLKSLKYIKMYEYRQKDACDEKTQDDTMHTAAFDVDISKVVLVLTGRGVWLYENLLKNFHIQPEMASMDYVILMTSIGDKKEWYDYLYSALCTIDAQTEAQIDTQTEVQIDTQTEVQTGTHMDAHKQQRAVIYLTPAKAMEVKGERRVTVDINKAAGMVSYEWLYAYPPGIPIICPGEIITREIIEGINAMKALKVVLKGLADQNGESIICIK